MLVFFWQFAPPAQRSGVTFSCSPPGVAAVEKAGTQGSAARSAEPTALKPKH